MFCIPAGVCKNWLPGILIDWGRAPFLPVGYDLATMLSKSALTADEIEQALGDYFNQQGAEQQLALLACYLHCLKDVFSKDMPAAKKPQRVAGFIRFYRQMLHKSSRQAMLGVFCLGSMLLLDL